MMRLRVVALAAAFAALECLCAGAQDVMRPKVVIVAYFEVGKDTGDRPGEAQLWVERDHLDRVIEVPGMSHVVRANADGVGDSGGGGAGADSSGGEPNGAGV
jgi:purine nucleoside permease